MASDERKIRTIHSIWIDAVNAGDLARLLTLVAEDVFFSMPATACGDKTTSVTPLLSDCSLASKRIRRNNSAKNCGKILSISR